MASSAVVLQEIPILSAASLCKISGTPSRTPRSSGLGCRCPGKPTTQEPYLPSMCPPKSSSVLAGLQASLYSDSTCRWLAGTLPGVGWQLALSFPGRRVCGKSVYQATPCCSQRWWLNSGRNARIASEAASYSEEPSASAGR